MFKDAVVMAPVLVKSIKATTDSFSGLTYQELGFEKTRALFVEIVKEN